MVLLIQLATLLNALSIHIQDQMQQKQYYCHYAAIWQVFSDIYFFFSINGLIFPQEFRQVDERYELSSSLFKEQLVL